MKIMVSGPIISWQIEVETLETVRYFIFLGSQIAAYGDCSHKIKRHLLLGRKAMTNLGSILKIRDITLLTNIDLVSYVFSSNHVWIRELDHKEAECQRIDSFELWCWRRLLTVPLCSRRSYQSILKEIIPEYSLELCWSTNTLATWCEQMIP